jgi:hypothetical protein
MFCFECGSTAGESRITLRFLSPLFDNEVWFQPDYLADESLLYWTRIPCTMYIKLTVTGVLRPPESLREVTSWFMCHHQTSSCGCHRMSRISRSRHQEITHAPHAVHVSPKPCLSPESWVLGGIWSCSLQLASQLQHSLTVTTCTMHNHTYCESAHAPIFLDKIACTVARTTTVIVLFLERTESPTWHQPVTKVARALPQGHQDS